ncbi:MAG: hypothetical protein FHK82_17940 [Sedimenticola thiotaurini]|uniref:Rhodanese domain-containing protein n=1 Tax=Sedimenticola thiotaurini TaxID=1543721 RepID=A0A558CGK4_9GAMM|nr:MAG: hypothetical protein FHK82_17940 [Sedimenticola thiotaurini]
MKRFFQIGRFCLFAGLITVTLQATASSVQFIERIPDGNELRVLDTRPVAECEQQSIKGARCFSVGDLLGHSGRLPSQRDITWMLGTLGLSGSETVVVVGSPGDTRDFIAGVLYLAGQGKVLILRPSVNQMITTNSVPLASGQRRSMSRELHYTAHPRDAQIVLLRELQQRLSGNQSLRLLDVRSHEEYWGELIKGWRGGHIPGAEHWSQKNTQPLRLTRMDVDTVVYGRGPLDSIASFVRLQAQWTQPAQVFIEGWRAWSADSQLPVDAESFYEKKMLTDS